MYAQEEVNKNVSEYFEDGGISRSKNLIKLNVFSTISGNLAITYERLFTENFTADASIGFLLPYTIEPIPEIFFSDKLFPGRDMGYSFALQLKLFLYEPHDRVYYSVKYSHNEFSRHTVDFREQLITFHCGYQFYIRKRINLEFAFGLGFRSITTSPDEVGSIVNIVLPLTFNIGYLL